MLNSTAQSTSQELIVITEWKIRRSGTGMTVKGNSGGKPFVLSGVMEITVIDGAIIAKTFAHDIYKLHS